ncbi:hypothetical protein O181_070506 [Austropuccinia psidii MF-1]|uniref:Uncharacterized protein n=1 Tax=Austropuccinia psidii MF-1 TaxID=1389203 RepID=A0A9Q3EYW4_9BASI|nr:hypothetical protein [Austropuccinia psidii MF-1]
MSQYQQYYTVYKDKDWAMLPPIHQGVMNSWHFLKEEEIVRYSIGWNQLSSKPQTKAPRREEEQQKELEKTIFPNLQDSKNTKRCHGQCLQHGQNLDGIQGQGGTKNEPNSFPKERTLSPDVVNKLTEIEIVFHLLEKLKTIYYLYNT